MYHPTWLVAAIPKQIFTGCLARFNCTPPVSKSATPKHPIDDARSLETSSDSHDSDTIVQPPQISQESPPHGDEGYDSPQEHDHCENVHPDVHENHNDIHTDDEHNAEMEYDGAHTDDDHNAEMEGDVHDGAHTSMTDDYNADMEYNVHGGAQTDDDYNAGMEADNNCMHYILFIPLYC